MMKSLKIMLWDEEIGRLAWDERRHLSYSDSPQTHLIFLVY